MASTKLTAELLVSGGEDPNDFERLREELLLQHDAQTTLECELVERLAFGASPSLRLPSSMLGSGQRRSVGKVAEA